MAAGDELLIVESIEAHRQGLRKLFDDAGYVCSATGSAAEAQDLLQRKFFPAVLVDLDVERPGAGLDLIRFARERSPASGLILLTGRRSFEAAVEAFRLGVVDVVLKQPDTVDHLRRTVEAASARYRAEKGGGILDEARAVLDECFRVVLDLARKVYDEASVGSTKTFKPRILIVDGDPGFLQELAGLVSAEPWEIAAEMYGGAALDKASEHRFDIVAARDELLDLRGDMVVKSIQATRPETLALLYSAPGGEGRIEHYEEGRTGKVERPFQGAAHLVRKVGELVRQLGATEQSRAVLRAFRLEYGEFLRRYAELKAKLDQLG